MSQSSDITLAPNITGTAQRTELNDILAAILTGHSGASRPSYLTGKTGGWTKIVSGTVHELYYFDGTDDILMGTVDFSTNAFTPSGSSAAFANAVNNKTAAYTLVDGDCGKIITADATSAAFSLAIDPTAGLRAGWFVLVQKTDATANAVTLDPDSTNTINGVVTFALTKQYDAVLLVRATASTFISVMLPNTANIARLDGAAFTVSPTMPTPTAGDNSTKGATTAFVTAANTTQDANIAATYAPKASPALTGTPTAPTAAGGTNTTQLATTAFVSSAIAAIPAAPVSSVSAGAGMTVSPTTGAVVAGLNTNNAGGVGSIAMLEVAAGVAFGATVTSGSFVSFNRSNTSGFQHSTGGAISGTWRNLGAATTTSGSGSPAAFGLFMRIS